MFQLVNFLLAELFTYDLVVVKSEFLWSKHQAMMLACDIILYTVQKSAREY